MIFVFIGGASASGKTGLSQHLLNKLIESGVSAQLLNMDDYFHERPTDIDPEEYRLNTNFDTPKMLHLDLLSAHLSHLYQGHSIAKPLFSFITNRCEGHQIINPSEIIIVEGIFSQYFYKEFVDKELPAVTINVNTENYFELITRRVKRDNKYRGRTPEEVIKQERVFVGPGFLKFTANSVNGSDLYIHNTHQDSAEEQQRMLDVAADEIILEIKTRKNELTQESVTSKKPTPDVKEMVAFSHLMAGTLFRPRMFSGYFNGVMTGYSGGYERSFSTDEIESAMSP